MGRTVHGLSNTRLYSKWYMAKHERLICDEWRDDFKAFYDWAMANGYKENLIVARIDISKGFSPSNCIIASKKKPFGDCRSRRITHNGETLTVSEWADKLGIKRITLYRRLNKGWDAEKALTEPINTSKRNSRWRGQ